MRIIRPRALRRGDVIGIAAPASPASTTTDLNRGIAYLEGLGYRVEVGPNVHRKRGYLAGTDSQRLSDLHALFRNPHVRAIFTVRGGYGSQRLLPLLDYSLIRRNPKILVGYSDITALHLAIFQWAGLISFSGPMVAVEMTGGLRGEIEEQFWRCLTSPHPPKPIHVASRISIRGSTAVRARGRLLGGNLSIVSSLVGTGFFPARNDVLLLLEEIDERPYRIDRMIRQISLAGILRRTKGIILGRFTGCNPEKGRPSLTLRDVLRENFGILSVPVVGMMPYGHIKHSLTIPIGIGAEADARANVLRFLEPPVV